MVTGTVPSTLPDSTSDRRLRVLLVRRRGGLAAFDLREQHYAEGLGWFDQRAPELKPRQLRQLQEILGPGRTAQVSAEAESPAILRFPGPGTTRASRVRQEGAETRPCRIFRGPASDPRKDRVEEDGTTRRN